MLNIGESTLVFLSAEVKISGELDLLSKTSLIFCGGGTMPHQDKKTKLWTGEVNLKGHPRKIKKGFPTKTAAKHWERQEKEELKKGEDRAYSLFDVADLWLVSCQKRSVPKTCEAMAYIAGRFLFFMGNDTDITTVTPLDIENFFASVIGTKHRGKIVTGKTINRYRKELISLFNFAKKHGIIERNPIDSVERYKQDKFKKYVPPREDIDAILAIATPFEHDILMTTYFTLARAGEIRHLKWEDVDLENRKITLWTNKRKDGREDDSLAMAKGLHALLYRRRQESSGEEYVFMRNGEQLTAHWLIYMMIRLCREAGVKYLTMHSIRHHVAALLAYRLSLIEVSKMLRHRKLTTTDIYLKSIVKIETRGIDVLDEINKPAHDNVVPFYRKKG